MGRPYHCRLCMFRYLHPGGNLPTQCPDCQQDAHWSAIELPAKDYVLTENDIRFLKSLRIAADNDHDDGA